MNESANPKPPPDVMPIEMRGVAMAAVQDPDFIVLKDVNWVVAPGEFWVVGAPHSSGKSDFLMTAAGLIPPVAGSYKFYGTATRIFDESRLSDRLRTGFVFEQSQLFHYLTVAENVALPLRYRQNLGPDEALAAIDELLTVTHLKPIADVRPTHLSPSWHKRAGLARALALRPEILLADNPLGALDARHSLWWRRFLDELWIGHPWLNKKPLTIVVTTDDFRPWRGDRLQFALLKEQSFVPLGSWQQLIASDEPLVKELLAAPLVTAEEAK
ncbi:MAG TPA: ATP-binding cassette domain-containing protein [Verrucomicrobiae bacterium]|jgi:ABC-type transporter Mla maintaining outer membrane lipid asymmetry ATPase subunit MlaF|nr:ATP-binding cassette domain-containing protein [Verrucomicrobiae bacterium]